ncbi:hypothetical protein LTR70_010452 [Exophiala xenobiotica]|uniref:Ubiquitin-protein ligase E3A N-terminal zinc-binding domain-containing protein n=1 Tax=Lithohypha guttulata TaxID=1690604 RepID=A0ABR0JTZ7_9EURO|nr:hypothetical protein LTR24_010422 [Lithohypha guttulata]KAK5309258.1 hypothetical protein LTR70_010452 [Exophiala xenobiotica]
MTSESLNWSAQLQVAPQSSSTKRLQGDKITLPQSALEALLAAAPLVSVRNGTTRPYTSAFDPFNRHSFAAEIHARDAFADRQQQLPHPLTFRLVNPQTGRVVYAGIREFSAEEGEIGLSPMLHEALGIYTDSTTTTRSNTPGLDVDMSDADSRKLTTVTVHHRTVPKGTYVKLRPLEAGYDPEDWKSLLERYLRDNFTTLTTGEVLTVKAGRNEKFRFLVDKIGPEGDAICVVDTDLEVDIEPMNEEQARETLNRRLAKAKTAPGTAEGSSTGGTIFLDQDTQGRVLPGEYVDFEFKQWDKKADIEVVTNTDEERDVDLFVTPFSSHLRARPRLDEHVFADFTGRPSKRLKLSHTNVNIEEAEYINIAIHAWKPEEASTENSEAIPFTLKISQASSTEETTPNVSPSAELNPDEVICKNCKQHVPKRSLALHEAFCYRNNVSCPKCHSVFLKNSDAWKTHWHCPHDDASGSGEHSRAKHDALIHPSSTIQCPACNDFEAFNVSVLAQHRTSDCPAKEILCQFCHLIVPQQGPDDPSFTDAEVLMSGMTPHEYADGARTTECHICSRIVRLRGMKVHMRLHDRERIGRSAPRLCSNEICGRTIKAGDEARVNKEQLGLCNDCFGPLYITQHDPEGKALRRRVERRLLQQLMSGCGKSWCHNAEWCRTGHKNGTGEDRVVTTKNALPLIKPVLEALAKGETGGLKFCVDEAAQSRKAMAEMVAAEDVYELAWCVKALEEEHNDLGKARSWLNDRAPKVGEVAT